MSKKPSLYATEPQEERTEDTFWNDYFPRLNRYCHFLAQNKWDGDDIAQETFVKALKYSNQLMSPALLNKIAYHHWIDVVRKRKKETIEIDFDLSYDNLAEDRAGVVDILLKHFSPKQAVIFLLKEGFLYKSKEIAAILGTTDMAVKSILHRSKKRLEKGIDEEDQSLTLLWEEEEQEQLAMLFQESLEAQDPSVLIEALPSLNGMTDKPTLKTISKQTPSSTLCMAA